MLRISMFVTAVLCISPLHYGLAQGYPSRPIRLVVPTATGGGADIVARIIAPQLSERLGKQVVIDNRPGAGGMIGSEAVAKSRPDGYTLMMTGGSSLTINPAIYREVPYDPQRDFAPIMLVASVPNIMVVHPSVPVKTVRGLIALARAHPGEFNYGSGGAGTTPHLGMELFLSMAKLKMEHIPYNGAGPALIGVIAGHVAVMIPTIISGIPHVRSGRLRALAVTGAKRTATAPEIPTIDEAALPSYEAVVWYGTFAPAGTPKDIVARLHGEIVRILQASEVRERLLRDGADPGNVTPEEFVRFIRAETEKWAEVARNAGIKPQ